MKLIEQIRKLDRDIASQSRLEPQTVSARQTIKEWLEEKQAELQLLKEEFERERQVTIR